MNKDYLHGSEKKFIPQPVPTHSSPSVPTSFRDMLTRVKEQVEFESFEYRDKRLAGELCAIIAEVYLLAEKTDGSINVEGVSVPYSMVEEIYETLNAAHLEYVIDYFKNATYSIRNVKAYLRVALYNSVFKLELTMENDFRSDF